MLLRMEESPLHPTIFASTREFLQRAEPFLLQREVEHNLMLGLCAQLIGGNTMYEERPFHCVIETAAGEVVAAALRTPPYHLILSHVEKEAALPVLAGACLAAEQDLTGVLGKPEFAQKFTKTWRARGGQEFRLKMRQMLHRLDAVIPARPVLGEMRTATTEDAVMLKYWFVAFQGEAFGREASEWFSQKARRGLKSRLAQTPARHFLWWDGVRPVCWVSYTPTTVRVARVAPVYTPPSERGRGYASALVAAVSQLLLDRGFQYCSLYTDIANPTSNAIYRRIGYVPFCEINQYERVTH